MLGHEIGVCGATVGCGARSAGLKRVREEQKSATEQLQWLLPVAQGKRFERGKDATYHHGGIAPLRLGGQGNVNESLVCMHTREGGKEGGRVRNFRTMLRLEGLLRFGTLTRGLGPHVAATAGGVDELRKGTDVLHTKQSSHPLSTHNARPGNPGRVGQMFLVCSAPQTRQEPPCMPAVDAVAVCDASHASVPRRMARGDWEIAAAA